MNHSDAQAKAFRVERDVSTKALVYTGSSLVPSGPLKDGVRRYRRGETGGRGRSP